MSESENQQENDKISERPPVGNLTDFVYGVSHENPLDVEIAVDAQGKIVIFHENNQ